MSHPVHEIVTYTVTEPQAADAARADAQARVRQMPGFIAWTALSGAANRSQRADLVVWESREQAEAAAEAVGSSPAFAAFRASLASLTSMGHYQADDAAPAATECGVELGHFRLKPGVSETAMREAYENMVERHLSRQSGWLRQQLLTLDGGRFVDLAFARTRERAEAICASWQGQADCEAFLALIEPESMAFGTAG